MSDSATRPAIGPAPVLSPFLTIQFVSAQKQKKHLTAITAVLTVDRLVSRSNIDMPPMNAAVVLLPLHILTCVFMFHFIFLRFAQTRHDKL